MLALADEKPIIALCTPRGSGSIALIRLSGAGAIEISSEFSKLSSGKKLVDAPSHTIHHGFVVENENVIDQVLFLVMRAPKTFTGQDTVEISCHNNQFLIDRIIQQAILHGAHPAQRGEFSKRAFLNGKIDLIQAEALNDLIGAQTELALKKSMEQLHGTLSEQVKKIETDLVMLLSLVQASFEFLEEEQRDLGFDERIVQTLRTLIAQIQTTIQSFNNQTHIKQGIRIALLGSVNVGKSTLFNALINNNRAIVTDIPGTTRDAIEATCYKNGNFWLVIDTAGIRDTEEIIEQKGIERTWYEAEQADIILLVYDAAQTLSPSEQKLYHKIIEKYQKKIIIIANKIDKTQSVPPLFANQSFSSIKLCAKNKAGLEMLEDSIEQKIKVLFESLNTPFLLNQRQHDLLVELLVKLQGIESMCSNTIQCELVAYHIQECLETIAQLTGKTITNDVLNTIFSTFCIGK